MRRDTCPCCQGAISEREIEHTFTYGVETPTELTVRVPCMTCASCGFQFLDYRAEDIMDAAAMPLRARGIK